jgi:sialic acid synthase SpsE
LQSLKGKYLQKQQENRLVIYSCTSGYPVSFEDICLLEIARIKEISQKKQDNQKYKNILLICFLVAFEDICLLEIARIKEKFQHRVKSIGFSGHHLGIAVDIAAYVLGANWVERTNLHTATWKGTDHSSTRQGASRLPKATMEE